MCTQRLDQCACTIAQYSTAPWPAKTVYSITLMLMWTCPGPIKNSSAAPKPPPDLRASTRWAPPHSPLFSPCCVTPSYPYHHGRRSPPIFAPPPQPRQAKFARVPRVELPELLASQRHLQRILPCPVPGPYGAHVQDVQLHRSPLENGAPNLFLLQLSVHEEISQFTPEHNALAIESIYSLINLDRSFGLLSFDYFLGDACLIHSLPLDFSMAALMGLLVDVIFFLNC